MAHQVETMFSGEGVVPWHGLGTVVDGVLVASDALTAAGLDWNVRMEPLFWSPDNGETVSPLENRYATVRDSDERVLGVVSPDYNIFQNEDVFSFFDSVVESGEAKYTTAGSLQQGAKVFMTAKIGEGFTVGGEDAMETYLILSTSHDGTKSLQALTSTIRVVCANTLTLATRNAKTKWSLRHKSTLSGKVQEARESLQLAHTYEEEFQKEAEAMMSVQISKDQFLDIITGLLPDQKRKKERSIEELMAVYETEPTVIDAPGIGTGWQTIAATTYWSDHIKESRSEEARYKSAIEGFGATFRNNVRDRVLALA